MDAAQLAWNLFAELRKEILEAQRIRAQVIGFKITFVGTAVGLIVANRATVPLWLVLMPAFAAIFFDLLVLSYSFSIKRIANYLRAYVEPKLRVESSWPAAHPLWEEHLTRPENRQRLALVGSLGITLLISLTAVVLVLQAFGWLLGTLLSLVLGLFLAYDLSCYLTPFHLPPQDPPLTASHGPTET